MAVDMECVAFFDEGESKWRVGWRIPGAKKISDRTAVRYDDESAAKRAARTLGKAFSAMAF